MGNKKPRRPLGERARSRRNRREARLATGPTRGVLKGKSRAKGGRSSLLRSQLSGGGSATLRRQRAQRTSQVLSEVGDLFDTRRVTPEEVGAPSKEAFLSRLKQTMARIEHEKYATARLVRTKGLRGSWFGEVWEDVVGNLRNLWEEIGRFAHAERDQINLLLEKSPKRLLNGRGDALEASTAPTRRFSRVETATNVRLVPKGGKKTDKGKKYTDRLKVSFQGSGESQWMSLLAGVEIKVPKKGWQLKGQLAESTPRLVDADFIHMDIVDANGKFLRTETIPVERVVINPASTNRVGMSAAKAGAEDWYIESGTGRGHRDVNLRINVAVRSRAIKLVTESLFSKAALRSTE